MVSRTGVTVDPRTVSDWVRAFTPRCIVAARAHCSAIGRRWRVDETYIKVGKRWYYLFRAIDDHGQIVDVYLSDRRDRTAAEVFFAGALQTTTVTPSKVTTDKAKCYPSALRTLLPNVEHRTSKYLNNGLERDHQHLKGRIRPMRRFKTTGGARNFCRGHALIRNLARGHASLAAEAAPRVRLATAWSALAATL